MPTSEVRRGGVDPLDARSVDRTFDVNSEAEMLALPAQTGDMARRLDTGQTYVLATDRPNVLADWKPITVSSGMIGPHGANHTNGTDDVADMVGDAGAGGTHGLAPAPGAGDAAAGKYLDAAGAWSVPTGTIKGSQSFDAARNQANVVGGTWLRAPDGAPTNIAPLVVARTGTLDKVALGLASNGAGDKIIEVVKDPMGAATILYTLTLTGAGASQQVDSPAAGVTAGDRLGVRLKSTSANADRPIVSLLMLEA